MSVEKTKIKLSIREFSQPNQRSGHIDAFSGYGPTAQSGIEIHSRIQKRGLEDIPGYQKEVSLAHQFESGPFTLNVSGRADAIITTKTKVIIEEIKSTQSIERLRAVLKERREHPYLLQAQTYAYFYTKMHGEVPDLRLRLVSSLSLREELLDIDFDLEWYESWLERRLHAIAAIQNRKLKKSKLRSNTSENMVFPFKNTRPQQDELIKTVEKGITSGGKLMIQAPTGLGKTAGVMFPTLKESLSRGKQLIYVTPKNSQHRVAREFVEKLQADGSQVNSLTITSKAKSCMQDEPLCTPDHCQYARNYFDKLHENKIMDQLREYDSLDASVFREFAAKYEVCPFELSLDFALEADVVICDYNYVFSPRFSFARLLIDEEGEPRKANLVIDEAHNLAQRACDYFSPQLDVSFLEALQERKDELPNKLQNRWEKLLKDCMGLIKSFAHSTGADRALVEIDPDMFLELEARIQSLCVQYFETVTALKPKDAVTALLRYWSEFCFALAYDGEEHFTTYRKNHLGDSIKINCCDASGAIFETLKLFSSVVAFSATLKPFDYYSDLCGFSKLEPGTFNTHEFGTPFSDENRKIMVIPQISTRYRDRERFYQKIAEAICRIITLKQGNYFAFFPSFVFLERVYEHIQTNGYRIYKQERNMSPHDAEEVIEALKSKSKKVLALGVQGGVFSEGVDYPGDTLIGAFIVGPALPSYEFEREILQKYYDDRFGKGFEYAYVYPGMAKVIQSAGRVIRSETDRGIIILMDRRFCQEQYSRTMPEDWFDDSIDELVSTKILSDLESFWDQGGF